MRLYAGSTTQFIQDTYQNQIAEKLRRGFYDYYGFNPSDGEVRSWRNSLMAFSNTLQYSELLDHGIILEYQLPLTSKRLDCMIAGKDKNHEDNAVIVELKQWDKCQPSNAENEVMTWLNGTMRDVLHPSVQVGQYRMYLEDTNTAFYDGDNPVKLNACSYLHNYHYYNDDVIFDDKFSQPLKQNPVFTADDTRKLKAYLREKLNNGQGLDVLKRIENSKYRASKKLMDHVGGVIKGNTSYILLDDQKIAYDRVFAEAVEGFHDKQKSVIIIRGGPGTGKSVIAINLMADLLLKGYNAQYATGSRAFTQTLREIIGKRGAIQFKYFNSYMAAQDNEIDVLICDEAHRIRITSNDRYTPRVKKSDLAQVDELIRAAKVSVFLIDDRQVVRPNEIGSAEYISKSALKNKCKVIEFEELETQFRCNGSDAFINWVNNTLGIKRTANPIWNENRENFDFKIFDTPESLEQEIRSKAQCGFSARMTAGFCWEWSKANADGTLVDDIVIGDYKRPWNANQNSAKLAPNIPKETLWAYDPDGINQIGCIYTAQGFEFDYVGVIFGDDIVYSFDRQSWVGDKTKSADGSVKRSKESFTELVKNTYRVLLSRGMKGCYIYFTDKETERYFKSRIEKAVSTKTEDKGLLTDFSKADYIDEERVSATKHQIIDDIPKNIDKSYAIIQDIEDARKYNEYLPVFSLKAVATNFGGEEYVEQLGWMKADINNKLDKDMFIAQVIGKSMEPTISDGSYCVFRYDRGGSRNGLVVLVESRLVSDPESFQRYTIKRYRSKKEYFPDGTWIHKKIILSPDNIDFNDIVLENVQDGDFKVIAEYFCSLKPVI